MRFSLIAALAAAPLLLAGAAEAGQVRVTRDATLTRTTVTTTSTTRPAHCACNRHVRRRFVSSHRHAHRAYASARGPAVPYDFPPTVDYTVAYVDGPHLGPGGAEGAEPGYGHCRWVRVSDGDQSRWSKVCSRAGYYAAPVP